MVTPDPALLGFRRLEFRDLAIMHRWLNDPELLKTWGPHRRTYEEIDAKYGPMIEGEKPTHPYLILHGTERIGYIQTFRMSDYPDYWWQLGLTFDAASFDLFIGEAAYRHCGLGPHVIRRFLAEVVFALHNLDRCVIGPAANNLAAIRSYEKVGFRYLHTVTVTDEEEPEYLMVIHKRDLSGGS